LGIETLGGVMTKMITKNTTIPTKFAQTFSTADDNQPAVTIKVYQGEREMASGNKSLGEFNLEGIAPASRGTPQIEVSFDIDANGILHVGAKDKATGKENKITIKANSGLSEAEIQQMVKDAELNAEEDKKKLEMVQARNNAEASVHSVKKSLVDHADKVDTGDKEKIEAAVKEVEEALKGEDKDHILAKTEALMTVAQKLGEMVYADMQAQQQAAAAGAGAASDAGKKPDDDNVVDAEVKEVKKGWTFSLHRAAHRLKGLRGVGTFNTLRYNHGHQTRLLRNIGCTQKCQRRRDQKVVPKNGDEIPPWP